MSKTAAEKLFRELHPTIAPHWGYAEHWQRVRDVAFANQNDIVDFAKRHTPRSRMWARVGDYAQARIDQADRVKATLAAEQVNTPVQEAP